jgi:hypothetical protein
MTQVMMQVIMLVQAIMQVTSDDGVCDIFLLLSCKHKILLIKILAVLKIMCKSFLFSKRDIQMQDALQIH